MLEAGTQLGAFKVEREIGRGGMGVVYLATDTRLGRSVAIKALPPGFSQDADRLARFEREARTLAALHHPNVAMIHGVEEKDGARFLVLEYVEGKTLAERLDEGPLPVDEALSVCAQIAAGLEVAHEAGVMHRDLKPANVRLTNDGAAKVLDFGLAKGGEGSPSSSSAALSTAETVVTPRRDVATAIGVVMGTAGYMSPEQARGRSVDRRADIWALGCVLYECLTGQSPFRGETPNDTVAAKDKGTYIAPWGVTPDGKQCLAMQFNFAKGIFQQVAVPLDSPGEPKVLFEAMNLRYLPTLSPDGRWIAYAPKGGDGDELAIRANPLVGEIAKINPVTVIPRGASNPRWSRDGKTLYFIQDGARQMAVDVTTEPELSVTTPRQLFEWDGRLVQSQGSSMTGDGKRFLFIEAAEDEQSLKQVNVVERWAEALDGKSGMSGTK